VALSNVVCLRHYATSQRVLGSNPYKDIGFISLPNPSNRAVILVATQSLTEMSIRKLSGSKRWPACVAEDLTAICDRIFHKVWEPRVSQPYEPSTAYYRDILYRVRGAAG
jgi:hypothetical protein